MFKILENNRGVTIPVVLLALVLISLIGIVSISIATTGTKLNNRDEISKKALEYAEAGYNDYLWHLNDDVNFYSIEIDELDEETRKLVNGEPIEFKDGYYKVKVNKPSDTDRYVTIQSTGWTKTDPDTKRTILAKIRKKQFVHHVYVSNIEGSYDNPIWWTSGEQCHGSYHTNGILAIEGSPEFFDKVYYTEKLIKGTERGMSYKPVYHVCESYEPEKVEKLEFPKTNSKLKEWAKRDGTVFYGRTCIYLNGDKISIKDNKGEEKTISIPKNKVIYVDGDKTGDRNKFGLDVGNVFVSGELKGQLTIAAANNIYITYDDPTNWDEPIFIEGEKCPTKGGITYYGTDFKPDTMSYYDEQKEIWTRKAEPNSNGDGKDMLGLIANNDVMILHYGWPRSATIGKESWDYKWKWGWDGLSYRTGWHRVKYDVAPKNVTIHGAIFAVNGGFGLESYDDGYVKEDLIVWGNITQNERKPVGTFQNGWQGKKLTGYTKKYAHDPRMFYDYPPHILEPVNVGWEVIEWKEISTLEDEN